MTDKQILKKAILFELKMCLKYPHYKSILFFLNDRDKRIIIDEALKEISAEFSKYKTIRVRCNMDRREIVLENGSKFLITTLSENSKGYRVHHCLVDSEISNSTIQNVIMPMVLPLGLCAKVYPTIDGADISRFGKCHNIYLLTK